MATKINVKEELYNDDTLNVNTDTVGAVNVNGSWVRKVKVNGDTVCPTLASASINFKINCDLKQYTIRAEGQSYNWTAYYFRITDISLESLTSEYNTYANATIKSFSLNVLYGKQKTITEISDTYTTMATGVATIQNATAKIRGGNIVVTMTDEFGDTFDMKFYILDDVIIGKDNYVFGTTVKNYITEVARGSMATIN